MDKKISHQVCELEERCAALQHIASEILATIECNVRTGSIVIPVELERDIFDALMDGWSKVVNLPEKQKTIPNNLVVLNSPRCRS